VAYSQIGAAGIHIAKVYDYKAIHSHKDCRVNVKSLLKRGENRGRLSFEELERFVAASIPESCEECSWVRKGNRSPCTSLKKAPCRIYLYRVLHHLESKGLI